MDPAVTTGIFTIAGVVVTYGLTRSAQLADSRDADRQKAGDLLTQVVKGIGSLQIEKAVFAERRSSWRPNFLATGAALLHVAAGRLEGNWLRGAARGIDGMAAWDAAEGARFTDRFQLAALEVGAALVQLSLMSPRLQEAASQVNDALSAALTARKKPEVNAAEQQMGEAMVELRAAVTEFSTRKWWRRGNAMASGTRNGNGR